MAKWKQSLDPAQDLLRERKANWNDVVSAFIDNFLHFKKFLNGHINKWNDKKSPLSSQPNEKIYAIITELEDKFDEIQHESLIIIELQSKYSETRQKKKLQETKTAQVKEKRPLFDDLISLKRDFNVKSKAFIKYLIEFKKLINGLASKLHDAKSWITDPIPSNPTTHLDAIKQQFTSLIEECKQILGSQKERALKRIELKQKVSNVLYKTDSFESLAFYGTFEKTFNNEGLQSTPISRFISRLSPGFEEAPLSDDEKRANQFRLSFLDTFTFIKKRLRASETGILNIPSHVYKTRDNVDKAKNALFTIQNELNSAQSALLSISSLLKSEYGEKPIEESIDIDNDFSSPTTVTTVPSKTKVKNQTATKSKKDKVDIQNYSGGHTALLSKIERFKKKLSTVDTPILSNVIAIIDDLIYLDDNRDKNDISRKLFSLANLMATYEDIEVVKKKMWSLSDDELQDNFNKYANEIIKIYRDLLHSYFNKIGTKYNDADFATLKKLIDNGEYGLFTSADILHHITDAPKDWILQNVMGGNLSAHKIEVLKLIRDLKSKIDSFMKYLERDMDFRTVYTTAQSFNEMLSSITYKVQSIERFVTATEKLVKDDDYQQKVKKRLDTYDVYKDVQRFRAKN